MYLSNKASIMNYFLGDELLNLLLCSYVFVFTFMFSFDDIF